MNTPRISVVTICYNCVEEIERTIQSVVSQTYNNIEYIIIDGKSSDGTVDIINQYKDCIDYFKSEKDNGIYDAMNKGIIVATGDYIIFMNSGDAFVNKDILADVVRAVDFSEDIIYGAVNKCLSDCYYVYRPFPLEEMKWHMILPHQGTFVKLSYHKKHLFDTTYRSSGDYHFFYNAYYKYKASFKEIDWIISDYQDETGMSKDNFKQAKLEDLRVWGVERNLLVLAKTYSWFVYRDFKNIIKKIISDKRRITLRNMQLRKQGYKLIKK